MNKLSLITLAIAGITLATAAEAQTVQTRGATAKTVVKTTKVIRKVKVVKVVKVKQVEKPSNPISVVIKPTPTTPAKPTTPVKPAVSAKVVSGSANVSVTTHYLNKGLYAGESLLKARGNHELNVKNGDLNKLVVGKTTIDLLPQQKNKNGITVKSTAISTLNVGHYLTYAKHGNYMEAYRDIGIQGASVVFYQGYETPKDKVPTSGKAVYKGVAVHSVSDFKNPRRSAHTVEATSHFDVDFGNKKISGTITPNNKKFGGLKLAGKLEGNRIIGDAVNGYRSMEGRFFGPNAEEISGRYDVTQPGKLLINGTFGAKKK